MNHHLKMARAMANLMDNQFKLAGFRFGLDPIIGLVPILGDIFTTVLSFYIVWIAVRMKLPPDKISQMVANVLLDFFLGFIPLIGDAADFAWKANAKNMDILEGYAKNSDIYEGQVI